MSHCLEQNQCRFVGEWLFLEQEKNAPLRFLIHRLTCDIALAANAKTPTYRQVQRIQTSTQNASAKLAAPRLIRPDLACHSDTTSD